MGKLVEFSMEDGGSVVVEVEDDYAGFVPAGLDPAEIAKQAAQSLEDSLEGALNGARVVLKRVRELGPNSATVKLGVKLTAQAGAVVTKVGGEANFEVTLSWTQLGEGRDAGRPSSTR